MCLTPLVIYNRPTNYRKKSGALANTCLDTSDLDSMFEEPTSCALRGKPKPDVPLVEDHHLPFRVVPCGKCSECARKRRSDWYVRLRRQIECGRYSVVFWITWTWKNEKLPATKEELSASIRRYKDRMRKKYGSTPDHFMVTERGTDCRYGKRLHMHGFLMFKGRVPSFESIRDDWSSEGFSWVRELGVLPDGRRCGLEGLTYSMKYIFKSYEARQRGDKLSGYIYASLGLGLACLSSHSYRLKLGVDNTYRPTETFDGKFTYVLPRYLTDRVYRNYGAKPTIDLQTLIQQLCGDRPPGLSLVEHIQQTQLKYMRNFRDGFSVSKRCADLRRVFQFLILKTYGLKSFSC